MYSHGRYSNAAEEARACVLSPSLPPHPAPAACALARPHLAGKTRWNSQGPHIQGPPHCTPSPPTKSFPTKSPWVKLSGRLPIRLYGHENSHPLELRESLLESNPLKPKLLVGGLGVSLRVLILALSSKMIVWRRLNKDTEAYIARPRKLVCLFARASYLLMFTMFLRCVCLSVFTFLFIVFFVFSLSLYIYMYVCMYVCMYIYIYIYIFVFKHVFSICSPASRRGQDISCLFRSAASTVPIATFRHILPHFPPFYFLSSRLCG